LVCAGAEERREEKGGVVLLLLCERACCCVSARVYVERERRTSGIEVVLIGRGLDDQPF
jgi:hypothetical protein